MSTCDGAGGGPAAGRRALRLLARAVRRQLLPGSHDGGQGRKGAADGGWEQQAGAAGRVEEGSRGGEGGACRGQVKRTGGNTRGHNERRGGEEEILQARSLCNPSRESDGNDARVVESRSSQWKGDVAVVE